MARQNGRDLRIKWPSTTVLAIVNTKTITFNKTPVDVSGDSDDGFITLLQRAGSKQITFEASGFTDNETLRDIAAQDTSDVLAAATIEWLSSDGLGTVIYSVTCNLFMQSYAETGAVDGGLEFSASFVSSGSYEKVTA